MKKFQVITDGTSDIEKKFRDEYGIDDVKMVFNLNNREYLADLDWQEITAKAYYDAMRNGARSITGLVKTLEFEEKFTKYLEMGLDILYIACSSKLSGSIDSGKIVAEELLAKYPNRKIICYDSLRSNYAQGLMAIDAAKMANDGQTIEEVVEYFNEHRLNYQVYATAGSLTYLQKAGRIKAGKAFFGNLLGVKPIIVSDKIGNNYAFMKVKGRKTSLDTLVDIIRNKMIDPENNLLCIAHADCITDALYIKSKVEDLVKHINISDLGPIIGATCGPDTICCCYYGEKVDVCGEE